jgi:hypothetical protein
VIGLSDDRVKESAVDIRHLAFLPFMNAAEPRLAALTAYSLTLTSADDPITRFPHCFPAEFILSLTICSARSITSSSGM